MEIILAILGIAGLLWGAILMLRGGLIGGGLLVVLAGSCFGQPFFKLALGPLPVTIDRVLLGILAMQYIVLRRWGSADPKPLLKVDNALFAFMAVLTVSLLTHDFKYLNSAPIGLYLFFYLLPLALYWIVRQAPITERAVLVAFAAAGFFGIYLSATAIAEARGMWSLVFPTYMRSPDFVEFFGRGRGPFLNPAACGFYQGTCICAGLMWWPRLNRWGQLAVLAMMPVVALGVYSTMTRSAWMGVLLGIFIVVACGLPRVWRPVVLGSLLLSMTIGVACTWQHFVEFKRDKNLDARESLESAKLRPILARIAWSMFLDRPIQGFGFGQYLPASRPYLFDRTTDLDLEKGRPYIQHNVFLSLLTETGLVGMGLWIAVLTLWCRNGWRLWCSETEPLYARQCGLLTLAMIGVYLPNGMFQDVSVIPMVNTLLLFVGGLSTGLAAKSAVTASPRAEEPAWRLDGSGAMTT